MAQGYVHVPSAPVQYLTTDGVLLKMKLQAINDVKIANAFNSSHVRGVVGVFNSLLSRFMFFGMYKAPGKERPFPQAQEHIFMSAEQLSDMIGRSESQVRNIINQLRRTLDITTTRSTANKFRLSERVIEFLAIYKYEDLLQFFKTYNIEKSDQYALKQLYHYRIVRLSDGNMNREKRMEYYEFMKDRKHRDFVHQCAQNNVALEKRVEEVEAHIDELSDTQKSQLNRIKNLLKETPGKLQHYYHWLLIKLQQFVSFMADKENILKGKTKSNKKESKVVDRNKTEGEQRTTDEVAAVHKKEPESISHPVPTLKDVVEVALLWNIMATEKEMDQLYTLTDTRIKAITNLLKSHGKDYVLHAVKNTNNLYKEDKYKHLVQFKDFVQEKRFNTILNQDNPDTRLTSKDNFNRMNKLDSFNRIIVPEFKKRVEAKYWFKKHNQM